jgi:PPK2 family polyphosphate:nucleotide phosphotransferase
VDEQRYMVRPGRGVALSEYDPADSGGSGDKEGARAPSEAYTRRLDRLQELLYADGRYSLLIVLQAMDTGGKDGVIEQVFRSANPQGIQVSAFKAPTAEELAHDFLWRVHARVPAKGIIGIFNRSHYEDVLVVRVHGLVPAEQWQRRYEHINHFEKCLADSGTVILKFFLHVSRAEQKRRLQQRLDDPSKRWKFSEGDLRERLRWDDYMCAYEDALNLTSTPWAPWYVIPADHKWYRNLLVSSVIVGALEGLGLRYPEPGSSLDGLVIPD